MFSLFLYWERVLLQSFIHTIWYLFHVLSNKGLHGPRSSLYWSFIYKKEFLKSIIRNTMLIMMYLIMCNNKKNYYISKKRIEGQVLKCYFPDISGTIEKISEPLLKQNVYKKTFQLISRKGERYFKLGAQKVRMLFIIFSLMIVT